MSSVKANILLNGLNTITGIIFPVITFPYAARVLLPEGIGAVNFLNSIVSYIVLLTSLGIPLYAVKEIAKHRDDKAKRDRITVEVIILSFFLCLIGYIIVFILAEIVPQIHAQSSLFFILSISIIFTSLGVEWFYKGTENFKFITIRAIIIRTLTAAALFLFVKDSSDIIIYGLIVVGSTVGNNIINFFHLRKIIKLSSIRLKELNIFKHLTPALHVFILNLIISLYIQLNSVMLGLMSGDEAVGFFTAGTKISHIGLTIISSLGTVLLPRCAHLLKTGNLKEFNSIIKKSLNVTLALSMPMIVGLIVLAMPITIVFCGEEFLDSVPILYFNAPVIIFISLTNLIGIQILYPKDKINIVIFSVSGGAVANLALNFILIPKYGATGAAISTFVAEFAVLIIQIFLGRKYIPFSLKEIINIKYITGTAIMGLATFASVCVINSYVMKVSIGILVGIVSYATYLIFIKDPIFYELCHSLKKKINHAKH